MGQAPSWLLLAPVPPHKRAGRTRKGGASGLPGSTCMALAKAGWRDGAVSDGCADACAQHTDRGGGLGSSVTVQVEDASDSATVTLVHLVPAISISVRCIAVGQSPIIWPMLSSGISGYARPRTRASNKCACAYRINSQMKSQHPWVEGTVPSNSISRSRASPSEASFGAFAALAGVTHSQCHWSLLSPAPHVITDE